MFNILSSFSKKDFLDTPEKCDDFLKRFNYKEFEYFKRNTVVELLKKKNKDIKKEYGPHIFDLILLITNDEEIIKRCILELKNVDNSLDLETLRQTKNVYEYYKFQKFFTYEFYNVSFFLLLYSTMADFQTQSKFIENFWANVITYKQQLGDDFDFYGYKPDLKFLNSIYDKEKVVLYPFFKVAMTYKKYEICFFTFHIDCQNSIIIDTIQGKNSNSNDIIKKGLLKVQNWQDIIYDIIYYYAKNKNEIHYLKIIDGKDSPWTEIFYKDGSPHLRKDIAVRIYNDFAKSKKMRKNKFGEWQIKV